MTLNTSTDDVLLLCLVCYFDSSAVTHQPAEMDNVTLYPHPEHLLVRGIVLLLLLFVPFQRPQYALSCNKILIRLILSVR